MKKNIKYVRKLVLAGCAMIMFSPLSSAQEILEKITEDHVNFQQTVNDAELYFDQVGRGKGTGYKIYERWKARASARVMEDGYVLSDKVLAQVLNNKQRNANLSKTANSSWQALGPLAWTNGGGYNPGVGRVTAIAVEPNNQQIIYIGSPGGGLWKTANGGSSWLAKGDNFDNMDIWGVAIDPSNSNTVYYGNGIGELYKSTNGGDSFTKILDKNSGKIQSILIHPTNSNIIHVGVKTSNSTARGIYKTTDGGANWTRVLTVTIEDIVYKPGSTSIIYAAGDNFYKSTNSGDAYTQITSGIQSSQRMKIAVSPANSNYVYIVQRNGSSFGWFYQSTNSGDDFTVKQEHTTSTNYIGSQASRDMAITVSNTNANEVHIGGFEMYVTTNGGTSFTQECDWYYPSTTPGGSGSGQAYVHADIEVLQYIDGALYAGTDGGIFKSTDAGDNFTDLSTGLGITQFYRINSSVTDKYRVAAGAQDNGVNVKSNANHSWVHMMGADGMEVAIDPANPDIIYGMIQRGKLYKSTNGGLTRFTASPPPESGTGNWITPMALDPNNGDRVYAGYDDLYRNDNGASSGSSWINLSTGISFSGNLSHIELCPTNSNVVYVARSNRIWVSTDINAATPTWTLVNTGISGTINDIAVDPTDETRVVVCTSSGNVYESTNSGSNWTNIKAGLPSVSVISVVLNKSLNQGIYAAIDGAVYFKDNTTPWTLFSNNLPKVAIDEIELYYDAAGENKVRIATYGRGLWEASFFDDNNGFTCASTISSFPYNEGFETGTGGWVQDITDDFDWTRKTGSTTSSNTGPTGAAAGSYYMYTESSSPNYPVKVSNFLSPCFDLSSLTSPQISFQYHMYGTNMGTLKLEASSDGNTWTTLWTKSGDQGNVWNTATVSLWAFASGTVQLRFNGTTSTDWTSDISIDEVSIQNGAGCTATVSSYPYAESFETGLGNWSQTTSDDFDWIRKSGGTTSTGTGPAGADDGTYYMYVEASSPNYPTKTTQLRSPCFNLSGIDNPEFTFRYHMLGSSVGSLNLKVSTNGGASWLYVGGYYGDQGDAWKTATIDLTPFLGSIIQLEFEGTTSTSYQGDMCIDKLSLASGISCSSTAAMPYAESFDLNFGAWSQGSGDDMDWTRKTGKTSSGNTGPAAANDGSHYIYIEASSPNYPSKNAYLVSDCISLNGAPELSFMYHMYGAAMGTLRFQVSTDGTSWSTLWTKSGNQGDTWYPATVDLSAYANSTVKFRLFGSTGSSYTSDICVDKITIQEQTPEAELSDLEGELLGEEQEDEIAPTVERELLVFPNPARDLLNIQYMSNGDRSDILLYNIKGQLVLQQQSAAVKGMNLFKLNIDELPAGIYFLRMQVGGTLYNEKIEVIR